MFLADGLLHINLAVIVMCCVCNMTVLCTSTTHAAMSMSYQLLHWERSTTNIISGEQINLNEDFRKKYGDSMQRFLRYFFFYLQYLIIVKKILKNRKELKFVHDAVNAFTWNITSIILTILEETALLIQTMCLIPFVLLVNLITTSVSVSCLPTPLLNNSIRGKRGKERQREREWV